MKYLLDTDRVIDFLLGRPSAMELIEELEHDGLAISEVTLGEIYEGIFQSKDPVRAEVTFQTFLTRVTTLPVSPSIWKEFAQIRGLLRMRGQMIPDFDLIIAATAIHQDLVLVSRNIRHFQRIPDLNIHGE